jgi:glycerol kinase
MLLNTGHTLVPSPSGLLTTMGYAFDGQKPLYALEGSVAVTGSAVQWLRDQLEIIRTAADVETLAASVPDTGGVYFVPAFSGLFAPYWRTDARGVIAGLSRFHTKAHLALRSNWKADRQWEPSWSNDQRETAYAGWKKAVEKTLRMVRLKPQPTWSG